MIFEIGSRYTRNQIQDILSVPEQRRGGIWNTGYTRFNKEIYIFCNIDTAGRTGHDYPNRWDGRELIWYGKTGSHAGQPLIKEMISGFVPVHIFWRNQEYDVFTYAGIGQSVDVRDTSPVEIRWRLMRGN
jgi:putative restriction endonuclease